MEKHGNFTLIELTCKSMVRRWLASLLMLSVAAMGASMAVLLQDLTTRQEITLHNTIQNSTISCTVTNARGTDSGNLQMLSAFVEMLEGNRRERGCFLDSYVKNVRAKSEVGLESPAGVRLRRILSLASDPALAAAEGATVSFYAGWSEEALREREQICLVPAEMAVTDFITISVEPEEEISLRVVGIVSNGPTNVIYCPFFMPWQEGTSIAVLTDSCSFDIRDNQELEASKTEIYQWFVKPELSNQYDGMKFGVLVHDEIYEKSIQGIQENLSMLRLLLPVLMCLCGAIGFFSSFLAIRGRTGEYAVMRLMGMSQWSVLCIVCFELTILALLGAATGIGLGFLWGGVIQFAAIGEAAILTGVFILGAAIAAARVTGVNVMKLMKTEDEI